jgi:hypothetical protein
LSCRLRGHGQSAGLPERAGAPRRARACPGRLGASRDIVTS